MKYMKRTGIYKSSNVTFDPRNMDAHSYVWWRFVAKVGGVVIFNNHYYSPTTSKHQSKVRGLLADLGIKIDIEAPFPNGIKQEPLSKLVLQAEENLCDLFLRCEEKLITRNERAKTRSYRKKALELKANIVNTLENEFHFRDYEIMSSSWFGRIKSNPSTIHKVLSKDNFGFEIENSISTFVKDGYSNIVFYVEGL